jgi:hypothetical protein
MKTLRLIGLLSLATAAATVQAHAQTSPTNINPALTYYQAFLAAPTLEPADREFLLGSNDWRGQKLPTRLGELIAQYDSQFSLVQAATRAAVPCDWGIDVSRGAATLLPHLARTKAVAVTVRVRALWDLQEGRPAEAAEDLLATLALGRNVSRDGTFISALVQNAVEAIVCGVVAENFGRFPPETLKRLEQGFDAAPARGTVAASMGAEKRLFYDWCVRRIQELQQQHPGNDTKVMEEINHYLGFTMPEWDITNRWERITRAAGGTSAGVLRLVQEDGPTFDRMRKLMALPYAEYESQLKTFQAEVANSTNPFTADDLTIFSRGRPRELRVEVMSAMVRAAIEYKLHGDAGLQSVKDPCGDGSFSFQRFFFQGVDRGFALKSPLDAGGFQQEVIFVEKEGPRFLVDGPRVGQAKK